MNETLTFGPEFGCSISQGGDFLPLPSSISERSTKQLSLSAADLLRGLTAILNDLVSSTAEKRTAAEFQAVREEVLPNYYRAMHAYSSLATVIVPAHNLDRIVSESFCELEADLREHAVPVFGREVRDQAMFTVWTFRKIWGVSEQIKGAFASKHERHEIGQLMSKAQNHLIWARFHLDCLIQAMRHNRPIYPAVFELIIDGLRAAVNTYALLRQVLDKISPQIEEPSPVVEWDQEEAQLFREVEVDLVPDIA
jgi:hypothetical protein